MKRAAAIGVVTWAGCAAVYFWLLRGRIAPALLVSIVAGLFMAVVIGSLRIVWSLWRDADRIAESDVRAPEDGEPVTIAGRLRVEGTPLEAPFTGRPAAVYSYEISHVDDSGESPGVVKDYSGLALAPCVLETAHGPIALHGFPLLEGFERSEIADYDLAKRYVRRTSFTELTGFRFAETIGEVRSLVGTQEQALRKDWRLTAHGVESGSRIFEEVVLANATVCATGMYSATERALLPGDAGALRLVAGSGDEAAATLRRKAWTSLVPAAVIGLVLNGIVLGVYRYVPANAVHTAAKAKVARRSAQPFLDAAYNDDLPALQKMMGEGVPADTHNSDGSTALFRVHRAATAEWLLAHGADVNARATNGQTPLMEQSSKGNAEVVKTLIAHHAHLDDVDAQWKMTALAQALHAERMDVVQLLRDAGAKDDTVTETTGSPLAESDPPVRTALTWLDAVFEEDRGALSKLWFEDNRFADVDFKIWKGARPHPAKLLRAFGAPASATVWLRGPNADGLSVTWRYDLVLANGVWKVRGESWETRFDGR